MTKEDRLMAELYAPENTYKIYYILFWMIKSHDEINLLCYLMDIEERNRTIHEWIPCTVKKLEDEQYIPKHTQTRLLNKLSQKGFIEIKRKGFAPAIRHVRINYIKIGKAAKRAAKERDRLFPERGNHQ